MPAAEKSSQVRSREAFTLLELLTSIAIIAVLMSLLVTAISMSRGVVRRTQAKNELSQIVAAIKAYNVEYGRYPITPQPDGLATEVTFATDNSDLFYTLCAIPNGANNDNFLNPRQIRFLDIPAVSDALHPRAGLANGNWYDPWGSQAGKPESGLYHVRIDGTNSGVVTDPYPGAPPGPDDNGTRKTLHREVIAWSLAKTGVQTYDLQDQVLSWK